VQERTTGLWMTLAAAVLFAVSAVVAADVFEHVSPARVAQFRSVFAAIVLGAVAARRRLLGVGKDLWWTALMGANLAAVTVTFYWAIDRLGVGPGTTIQFTAPVLVMVWMRVVEKRHVPPLAWLAAVAAVLGTGLMARAWEADVDGVGLAAAVGAALTFGTYLVLGERLGSRLPSLTTVTYGFAFSALFWLLAVPPQVGDLGGGEWARLAFIGVAGTAIPFLLELSALRRADPGSVGVVATAEPVVSAACAWVFLGQALTPAQVVGGALTAVAVAAIHLTTARRRALPLPPA
jgi:drug/metabolite transporter (DMT)-like permease